MLEPWQINFSADLLSGMTEDWLVVPEGNGKTTLFSAHALFHADTREAAMVPAAAASRDQGEILFRQAEGFVRRSPSIRARFECLPGYRQIRCAGNGSRIQVFAADDKTGDGVLPTLALIDEPHRQKDMSLYRTWRGKLDKRHGQIALISTAGEPGHEFELARERLRQLLPMLERTETYLHARGETVALHEFAVPERGDVEDFDLVKRANPLSTITIDSLRRKFESPTMDLLHWRRFVCNLATRTIEAAITEAEWARAESSVVIPDKQPIWLGLDVAWKWDTTALVPFWWRDQNFRLFGPVRVLVPPRDGSTLDPMRVEREILLLQQRWPIHTVVMDMTRAEQLGVWLQSTLGCRVVDRTQSNRFAAEDYERFMDALRNGHLHHSGNLVFKQHVLNAISRLLPDGKSKFDRSSRAREGGDQNMRVIDALIAAAMVHGVAAAAPAESPPDLALAAWR